VASQQLLWEELRLGQWWRKEAAGKGCRLEAMGKVELKRMFRGSAKSG